MLYARHVASLAAITGACCAVGAVVGGVMGSLETMGFSLLGGLAAMLAAFPDSAADKSN